MAGKGLKNFSSRVGVMVHGLFMRLARIKRLAKTKKVSSDDLETFNFSLDAIIRQLKKQEERT